MYKEYSTNSSECCAASVSAGHELLHANEVEHRLDEFWEVVIVFPAPVVPCVGVVKVHGPTVSCRETKEGQNLVSNYKNPGIHLRKVIIQVSLMS